MTEAGSLGLSRNSFQLFYLSKHFVQLASSDAQCSVFFLFSTFPRFRVADLLTSFLQLSRDYIFWWVRSMLSSAPQRFLQRWVVFVSGADRIRCGSQHKKWVVLPKEHRGHDAEVTQVLAGSCNLVLAHVPCLTSCPASSLLDLHLRRVENMVKLAGLRPWWLPWHGLPRWMLRLEEIHAISKRPRAEFTMWNRSWTEYSCEYTLAKLQTIAILSSHHAGLGWVDDSPRQVLLAAVSHFRSARLLLGKTVDSTPTHCAYSAVQDNVVIPSGFFQFSYHIGCAFHLHSIINSGLIPGVWIQAGRQSVFFLPVNPRNEGHQDPAHIDFSLPRRAQYLHNTWKRHQDAVNWVDINLAIRKRLTFCQTRSTAIIL